MRRTLSPNQPVISVVIPAYNEARYLPRTLASLYQQRVKVPFEAVVADNNSTDETAAVARSAGARVVPAAQPGVCAARQAGTEAARGQIIVSTDADTHFHPDWLANIYAEFERDPSVVFLTGEPEFENPPIWFTVYYKTLFRVVHWHYRRSGRLSYASAANLAFRKSAWTSYDTGLTQGGDEFDLLKRIRPQGRAVMIDNPVYTSSRRLKKGLLYNLFVYLLLYYVIDYNISRFTGRSLFGSYQAVREQPKRRKLTFALKGLAALAFAFVLYHSVLDSSAVAHAMRIIHRVPAPHLPTQIRNLDLP